MTYEWSDIQARLGPDYSPEQVRAILGHRDDWTPLLWIDELSGIVQDRDILWLCCLPGACTDRVLRLFAADCAERSLWQDRNKGWEHDPQLWAVVETARRHAAGTATDAELRSAWPDGLIRSAWTAVEAVGALVQLEKLACEIAWAAAEAVAIAWAVESEASQWRRSVECLRSLLLADRLGGRRGCLPSLAD